MKVLVFSSLARDTGCWRRAEYLVRALNAADDLDVELVAAPPRCLPLLFDVWLSLPRYLWRAVRSDADVSIAMKPFPNVAWPLLLARRLRGGVVVVDVDDLDDAWFDGIRAAILRRLLRPMPRRFDLVTSHHPALRERLVAEFGVPRDRIEALPQGVDREVFRPRGEGVAPGRLLYVGHLNVASELPEILRAVKIVQARRRAPLRVVGGGPCADRFRALAGSLDVDASFTGLVDPEAAAVEIERAEVCLVYHSPTEANRYRCSMKLRECLAMGKKIVCSDFGELADFADVTYQAGSTAEEFATGIERALDGGDGRERRGPSRIASDYDWSSLGAAFAARLRALVRER